MWSEVKSKGHHWSRHIYNFLFECDVSPISIHSTCLLLLLYYYLYVHNTNKSCISKRLASNIPIRACVKLFLIWPWPLYFQGQAILKSLRHSIKCDTWLERALNVEKYKNNLSSLTRFVQMLWPIMCFWPFVWPWHWPLTLTSQNLMAYYCYHI